MANVSVYNIEGKEVGTIDLSDAVFGVEVNEHLVHMAVVSQLANKRQGTQKAKTRSEVSGGGRKPMETERDRSCKTGFYKISTVDRRWSCIRSNTKRLLHETQQKRKKSSSEICTFFKSS